MNATLRRYGLTAVFGLIFALALLGQLLTGHAEFNNQQVQDGLATVSQLSAI